MIVVLVLLAGCASPATPTAQPAAPTAQPAAPTAQPAAPTALPEATAAQPAATTAPAAADAGKTYKFAIVYSIAVDFFDTVTRGAQDEIKSSGKNVELIVKAPDKGDVNQQIEIMENLIYMKVDGIAIGPSDSDALTPYIDKAIAAGIPVITFDTDAPNSKRLGYVGTNNYEAGKLLGQAVADVNPNAQVICTISVPTQLGLQQRVQGAKDLWAAKYPNIKLLDMRSSGGDPAVTLSNIEDMTKAYPNFDILIGIDAQGGPAAVSAWKALGLVDKKKAVVFDDLPAVVQGIRDGQITTAISQFEYKWGSEIINKLWDVNHGGTVPALTEITAVALTKDNVDQYFPKP
jgi:ribose transport system substrate-binding protein